MLLRKPVIAVTLVTVAFAAAAAADAVPSYVGEAVASISRPPEDKARDADRKPAEMVAFVGVKPGDKVLELAPGAGYYTRILAKSVGAKGKVYAFVVSPPMRMPAGGAPPGAGGGPAGGAPAGGRPDPIDAAYRLSRAMEFRNIIVPISGGGPASGIGIPEAVDVVWTSDNYHDFHNPSAGLDIESINKGVFRDLKAGGVYIIIDHASAPGTGASVAGTLHRIDQELVKKEVLAAGFVLDGESKTLANPADDHTKPVFQMHDKADEFVLRFRKPASAVASAWPKDGEMQPYFGNTFIIGTPEQRQRTIFLHEDHSYQEFGTEGGITNGYWYLDADGNACMMHQSEARGSGTSTACRGVDFPKSSNPKLGETRHGVDGRPVALMQGYVYPNAPPQMPPGVQAPAQAPDATRP